MWRRPPTRADLVAFRSSWGEGHEGLDLVGIRRVQVGGCDRLDLTDLCSALVVGHAHDRLNLSGLRDARGGGMERAPFR